ncbi:MAG: glycosyltransferase family 4 protein [Methanomethylovorans sp.]|jgi:N-acetyl-alpha-D-glucosaminyl L-malate synthase BshA|nr:glycosyltransferase family 4 protein [Methanomethylovorans sp.]
MKIAIVVLKFPPKWIAGTEIAAYNIAKHLAKKGHEVHVITVLDEGLSEYEFKHGFFVHRVPSINLLFLKPLYIWIKFFLRLRSIEPDIVHIQSIPLSVPAFFLKLISHKNYIIWVQGSDIYRPTIFLNIFSNILLKEACTVIALTEGMRKEIYRKCKRDIIVIPNGIDLDKFSDGQNLNKADLNLNHKYNSIRKEQKIIFVGTLRPIKGVRYLIEAMTIIKKTNPYTKLIIIGDGQERGSLEKLTYDLDLRTHVSFLGKVSNDEIPKYMKGSDVLVLPSLSESFGIVNIEAMASGVPIVSTNVGGLSYIIKDGVNGFLVNPKDPGSIAEKCLQILNDSNLKEQMSKNNLSEAEKYSWDKIVERLLEVYKKGL